MNLHEKYAADIERCGFTAIGVPSPQGTFYYSIGLTDLGHPEILISGLAPTNCHGLLWEVVRKIKAGGKFAAGQVDETIGNFPVAFRYLPESAAQEFCCQALFYYEDQGKTPTFLQMVIADQHGVLPWQDGYDAEYMKYQRHLWVDLN